MHGLMQLSLLSRQRGNDGVMHAVLAALILPEVEPSRVSNCVRLRTFFLCSPTSQTSNPPHMMDNATQARMSSLELQMATPYIVH